MFRGGRTEVTAPKPVRFPVSEARLVGVRSVRLTTFRRGVDAVELSVVEGVEGIQAKFEPGPFLDPDLLRKRDVPAVDRRAIQEVAAGFQAEASQARAW